MKARLVRIGNSRGVRLPKPLIEEADLNDEVEVRARQGAVIITPTERPRSGWAEAAKRKSNNQSLARTSWPKCGARTDKTTSSVERN